MVAYCLDPYATPVRWQLQAAFPPWRRSPSSSASTAPSPMQQMRACLTLRFVDSHDCIAQAVQGSSCLSTLGLPCSVVPKSVQLADAGLLLDPLTCGTHLHGSTPSWQWDCMAAPTCGWGATYWLGRGNSLPVTACAAGGVPGQWKQVPFGKKLVVLLAPAS